jgi:hypothetical protein
MCCRSLLPCSQSEYAMWKNEASAYAIDILHSISHTALSSRASLNLTKKRVDMYVVASDAKELAVIEKYAAECASLSLASRVVALKAGSAQAKVAPASAASAAAGPNPNGPQIPTGCISAVVSPTIVMHLPVAVRFSAAATMHMACGTSA